MKPLLTILIATRNRESFCIRSVETILELEDDRIELVLQDNSDLTELRDYILNREADNRLKYNYTPPPFSSIDNFNSAISHSTGEYLCLIGDDDGICRQLIDVAEWAGKNGIDSVCPAVYSEYIWPETFGNEKDAVLTIPGITAGAERKDPETLLHEFFRSGALDYLKKGFPKLYHGIVRRSCLEKIKSETGHYLGGLSPDIYAAISLSCVVKSHVVIGMPLTIAGTCRASTTFASINGLHSGELRKAPHFRDRGEYTWDSLVPEVYSVETIWAETALKAAAEMKRDDLRKEFRATMFMARNILRNMHKSGFFVRQTWRHLVRSGIVHKAPAVAMITGMQTIKFFSEKLTGRSGEDGHKQQLILKNVPGIEEATTFATGYLEEKNAISVIK